MIGFLYILTNEFDGGGGDPVVPQAPKNYKPLSVAQRNDWNGFLDYVGKTPNANLADSNALFSEYKKSNPNFSLSPTDLQNIQYEQYQLRKGDTFGSLDKDKLKYIRQGLPESYLSKPIGDINGKLTPETSKLYYPQVDKYGTDIEGYYNAKTGKPLPTSSSGNIVPIPKTWEDSKQVQNYRNALYHKYGKGSEDIVDMPEYTNLQPQDATDTLKNLSVKAASKLGIKPEILFSSSMVEGMKGLATSAAQKIGTGEDWSGDKDYPISGFVNFGLDNFSDKYPDLVKKGYLSKDFSKNFNKSVETNEKKKKVNSANFKTVDAAIEAKAAMIKDIQDTTDQFAKQHGIKLSDRGRDFFTLIGYNGGEGSMQKMMQSYSKGGYLKDDKYIENRPTDSWKNIHREVSKRLKGADVLKGETYF